MRPWMPFLPLVLASCGSDEPSTNEAIVDSDTVVVDSALVDTFVSLDSAVVDSAPAEAPPSPKTIIHVHYPAGSKAIALRGSIAPWSWDKGVAMKPEADDTWTLEAEIKSDAEYKPLLDDATWARGPNYKIKAGTTVDIYPHFTQVKGKFEKRWPAFASKSLKTRGVYVYYPPTYLENTRAKFPVVYMHDGQNLFDASTAFGGNEWKVDETMDAAAEDGSIREAIVVGPENTADRMYEYTPTKNASYPSSGGGDVYLAFLVDELKPKVDAELRTLPARESTVVIGSSLGGLISAYAGVKKPTTFGLIGAMSPSTWWDNKAILKIVEGSTDKPLKVYVDSGDSGASSDDRDNTKLLADTYKTLGFVEGSTLKYVVQSGATHSEVYWAQRLPGALAFLLGVGR
jgi:predicted alpha/beta superfamily hydrolase